MKSKAEKDRIDTKLIARLIIPLIIGAVLVSVGLTGNGTKNAQVEAAAVTSPAAVLHFTEQNVGILNGLTADMYYGLPTQNLLIQLSAEYEDGAARIEYKKNNSRPDPQIYLPVYDLPDFELRNYPIVAVCYRSNATRDDGRMYFSTTASEGLDEEKAIGITMTRSSSWTVTYADLSQNANWRSVLTQLRLDISARDYTGAFYVRWVAFFDSVESMQAYGNGSAEVERLDVDKNTYAGGETINVTVDSHQEGDWVVLVQEGDACYLPSHHEDDLYVSDVMPLLWAPLSNGSASLSLESGGIMSGKLLPAGRYDVVLYLRGRYIEAARSTITVSSETVATPIATEKVLVTRDPNETPTPQPTLQPTVQADPTVNVTRTPTPEENDDDSALPTSIVIIVIAVAVVAAVVAIVIIRAKKKKAR